jgi:hypothetical protein
MMTLIYILIVIGAFYGGYRHGREEQFNFNKDDENRNIMNAFSDTQDYRDNVFRYVYKINGTFYLCIIDPLDSRFNSKMNELKVIIDYDEFKHLIALRDIGFCSDEEDPEKFSEKIEKYCEKIDKEYSYLSEMSKEKRYEYFKEKDRKFFSKEKWG